MSPETVAIVVGLLAGWVADFLVEERGYGIAADLGLGLGGAMLAVILAQAAGIDAEAGWFAMTLVSLVGTAAVIGAQRGLWARQGSRSAVRRMRL